MKEEMFDHSNKITWLLLIILIALVCGATANVVLGRQFDLAPSRSDEIWGYDPAKGTEEESIRKNFNLHRGRWWNYYDRGSWYLANKHYKAAEDDFREVIKKRLTDKRDCRTYGMHFRDCFAHRELGITLYYRAIQEKSDKISRLEESIKELNDSLKQAESSRAAFYLNLSKESLWKAKDKDVTAPVITVENAIRSGRNWAVVLPNPRTVQIDVCVTDNQSGVHSINVNNEELLIEQSAPKILKTVHIPIEDMTLWTVIHAKDLVDNNSPSFFVLVESDIKLPVFSGTIDPRQLISDGLVTAWYSALDNLDLSKIRSENPKRYLNGRREYNILKQIKDERSKSSMVLQATDWNCNTTKRMFYFLSEYDLARQHLSTTYYPARFTYMNQGLWSNYTWPLALYEYDEKGAVAKMLCAYGTAIPHIALSTFSRDQNPVTESDSVYSVFVLPLIPQKTPNNTLVGSQFPSFSDAVTTCKIPDGLYGEYYRFDCRRMKNLKRSTLETDLKETRDIRRMVRRFGLNLGVDLSLCGFIREYKEKKEYIEMEIYIEDNHLDDRFPVRDPNWNPIDVHGPKDNFSPYMKILMEKLKKAIPRVRGEVTRIGPKDDKNISINVGKDQGIFSKQKLHVFRKVKDISVKRLTQATVVSPGEDHSEARVEITLQDLDKDELFISSK